MVFSKIQPCATYELYQKQEDWKGLKVKYFKKSYHENPDSEKETWHSYTNIQKIYFQVRNLTGDEKSLFIMGRKLTYQEDIIIQSICTPNNMASECRKPKNGRNNKGVRYYFSSHYEWSMVW